MALYCVSLPSKNTMWTPVFALLAVLWLWVPIARAQPSHAAQAAALGQACVRALNAPPQVNLVPGSVPPFLVDRIAQALVEDGIAVHLNPTSDALPTLVGGMPVATVRLTRLGRREALREVALVWDVRLMEASGAVVRVHACEEVVRDAVPGRGLDALIDPRWPVAPDAPLPPSRLSRWGQPLVLGAATAISTLLLFSLRSR